MEKYDVFNSDEIVAMSDKLDSKGGYDEVIRTMILFKTVLLLRGKDTGDLGQLDGALLLKSSNLANQMMNVAKKGGVDIDE